MSTGPSRPARCLHGCGPTVADWGDGFTDAAHRHRLRRLLAAYGTSALPSDVIAVLRQRLLELADLSDRTAQRLHKPELSDHAKLYRRDAVHLSRPEWTSADQAVRDAPPDLPPGHESD